MLKNYLLIALRNLKRHKGYAFINIAGLTMGIACCLLIVLYVQDELSYDRFHDSADRIVRVVQKLGTDEQHFTSTSLLLGPTLAEAFPEVEHMVRLYPETGVVRVGDSHFQEDLLFVDSSFFDVFSFPLQHGDPTQALIDRDGIVLSEAAARTFFGDADPMGRTLSIRLNETFFDLTVRGVAAPFPSASSIRFDVLLPMEKLADFDRGFVNPSWNTLRPRTYLQLTESATAEALQAKLPAFVEAHLPPHQAAYTTYQLQPLTAVHLDPTVRDELTPASNPAYAYLLGGLAFFILFIACINFTTLSLGRSASRIREVGIRKVVGALRPQLMKQFWGEALLISLLALLLGLALVESILPVFNDLVGKSLRLSTDPVWLLLLVGILLLASLLAGSYPAVYLSRFHPAEVLKGQTVGPRQHRLTQGLVVVQFTLSIFLVISTLFMSEQLDLLMQKNLGYDEEQVVRIRAEYGSTWEGHRLFDRYQALLATEPSVHSLTGSMYAFADPEGMVNRFDLVAAADSVPGYVLNVTPAFLETLGIDLVQGRNFSEDRSTDATSAVLVNETLAEAFGWEEPLGKTLSSFTFNDATVIGVIKDFHYESLHRPVEPLALYLGAEKPFWHFYARIAPGNVPASLAALERAWHAVAPDLPFEFAFLDQAVDQLYRSEQRWAMLIRTATAIAIFIACLGLLGLAALASTRRRKEIGIRKVLGASIEHIVLLLTRRFVLLVLLAFAVAAPLAYLAMSKWLDDFAYRIEISGGIFLMAGLAALLVAMFAVSYQAVRAALANPVDALRYE